jgi:hypothetical protein
MSFVLVMRGLKNALTLSLLMSYIYIYEVLSKARNLTSFIYGRDLYWGFCLLNSAFR